MTKSPTKIVVSPDEAGQTLAAILRTHLGPLSWSQARQLIESRRILVGTNPCVDPARRLSAGEVIEVASKKVENPVAESEIPLRHVDPHLVVVEKPAGIATVRHPSEQSWSHERKRLEPTLDEVVLRLLYEREKSARLRRGRPHPLRIVQRLDKPTSGLLVFARSPAAYLGLVQQFRKHTVQRRYVAVIPGAVSAQRIESRLVRDRGDTLRGSTRFPDAGKVAITHIEPIESFRGYQSISCRLETGRTHQIRIHLSELGHPVCGDTLYRHPLFGEPVPDTSAAPRLALHACELGFIHPITGNELHFTMPLPADLAAFIERLRQKPGPSPGR